MTDIDTLLEEEMRCRIALHQAQAIRQTAEELCRYRLERLLEAKRRLKAAGFRGNIMRDANGERVNSLGGKANG